MRAIAIIVLVVAVVLAVLYFGEFVDFGTAGPAETLGEKVDDAAKATGDAVNSAAGEVEKATE